MWGNVASPWARCVYHSLQEREREREREIVPDIENQTAAETSSPRGECSLQKFPFCHVSRATRGVTNVTRERFRAFCTLIHGYSRLRVSSIKFFFWAAARRRLARAGGLVFFSFWVLLGSSGVPSGVLLVFFWCSITQKNTRSLIELQQFLAECRGRGPGRNERVHLVVVRCHEKLIPSRRGRGEGVGGSYEMCY